MLVDFPPYGTTNASNQPDGYDADVARLLAKDWGVKLNLVPVTGPNRIPFLLTNKVDLLIATLGDDAGARQAGAVLQALLGRDHRAVRPQEGQHQERGRPEELRIGVARASTQDVAVTAVRAAGHRHPPLRRRRLHHAGAAVRPGRRDRLHHAPWPAQIAKRVPADTFEDKFVLHQQEMAVALRPGQADLLKAVNDFVTATRQTAS